MTSMPKRRSVFFSLQKTRHCFAILLLLACSEVVRCFAVPSATTVARRQARTLDTSTPNSIMAAAALLPKGGARPSTHKRSSVLAVSGGAAAGKNEDKEPTKKEKSKRPVGIPIDPDSKVWPRFDALDKRLIAIAIPMIGNFAIKPIVGAVDLFWVNRMGDPLAVAGQAAANQIFNSLFWLTSFLPAVTATTIAKENAKGNRDGVEDAACEALFLGTIMALMTSVFLLWSPERVLSTVLAADAPAMQYAKSYLQIRAFSFVPAILSLVGFSTFRGILDTMTPVKISLFENLFNAVLDPIFIFSLAMGVPGAALATLAAEVTSAIAYLYVLGKRGIVRLPKLFRLPAMSRLLAILKGGMALQLRNVALNLTFLGVARVTQAIDKTGVAASAHAMALQTFQVGGIVLLALSVVAQTVVPNAMVERFDETQKKIVGGRRTAKAAVNRLMAWGLLLGTALGGAQIALLPLIQRATPLAEVRAAAQTPAIMASLFQIINGITFIGEGTMVGTGSFLHLSAGTIVATTGCLWALKTLPPKFGLTGVWLSFGVFNAIRLVSVLIHQFVTGPLAPKNLDVKEEENT